MLKEGKARLFIAGVLPVALYGAEHEPWTEAEISSIEKQAVKALQVRSPGVPHALARLMLPAVADPRFRVHFAAVERWSREIWATAYGYAEQVHGFRRVHKDALSHREIMAVWHRIHSTHASAHISGIPPQFPTHALTATWASARLPTRLPQAPAL